MNTVFLPLITVLTAWSPLSAQPVDNVPVYATLSSSIVDRLTGASTPIATSVELDEARLIDGTIKTRKIDGIDMPAGRQIDLKPDGLHITLLGLKKSFEDGDSFPVTLNFAKAGKIAVIVNVEAGGTMAPPTSLGRSLSHSHGPAESPR